MIDDNMKMKVNGDEMMEGMDMNKQTMDMNVCNVS